MNMPTTGNTAAASWCPSCRAGTCGAHVPTTGHTPAAVQALAAEGLKRIWVDTPDHSATIVMVVPAADAAEVSRRMKCGAKGQDVPGDFTVTDVLKDTTRTLTRVGCCGIRLVALDNHNPRQAQEAI